MFKKVLLAIAVLALIGYAAYPTVDTSEITFSTVTSGTFDQHLRSWFDTINQELGMGEGFRARGTIYYVDGNKSTSGTGTGGWDNAFNTLTAALAASHADMAVSAKRKWAGRNTIFCMGDALTEDLVLLAQKTDIIGVGNNNPYNKCGLKGNHDIPSTTATPSCRFYNFQFWGDEAAELWDVDGQSGLEFHGCLFQANASATVGLEASECSFLIVKNSEFGSPDRTIAKFTSSAIEIPNDTAAPTNIKIVGNIIDSGGVGINWDETVSVSCWINDNYIFSNGMPIDDEGDDVHVVNNRMITLIDTDTPTNGYDFNGELASGNFLTGSGTLGQDNVPPSND